MANALAAETRAQTAAQHENFVRLIEKYEPALKRLAACYVMREADRNDLFQEIAVALWKALPAFRGDSSERTWLYRIAHNIAISSAVKLGWRARNEESMPGHFNQASLLRSPEQETLLLEKLAVLRDCIRALHIRDRQIILLHLEGLAYSEIEAVTGCSEAAIASRLTRIRQKLKEKIMRQKEGFHEQSR